MSRSDFGMTFWSAWCHRGHGPSRTRLLAKLLGAKPRLRHETSAAASNCPDAVEDYAVPGLVLLDNIDPRKFTGSAFVSPLSPSRFLKLNASLGDRT